ncbi:low molecular weight protein-tyrosine-phosphatase [Olivibacter sitiensis]|uniref:low molecular weight protein-tyrosine-phosphatase n=1 Tax=Olivibacter sitiensis TaxID=376470 RepID=UPI0004869F4B|nr:low molecular weight protein-tyrosine-phosphatase [Olivibacter sitiensis]
MKILMVCLGNICRSPLAHGVFEHLVRERGLPWYVDSAGTGNWHIGEPPDRRSMAIAKRHGIDISCQRARQFKRDDLQEFDRVFAMDKSNYRDLLGIAATKEEKEKIALFLPMEEVPDPYWDDTLFEHVYMLVAQRSEQLIAELLETSQ